MNDHETDAYLLGTDRQEVARLGFQHQVWAPETRALLGQAGLRPGLRVLDLGCGPGFATLELAHAVGPEGQVTAVDRSQRFLEILARRCAADGVEQVKTVYTELDGFVFDPAGYDLVLLRWVLSFLPEPAALIERVAGALRPGGAIAVIDYLHYDAMRAVPDCAHLPPVTAAIGASFRDAGGSLDVGSVVPAALLAAGLEVRELRPVVHAVRPGSPHWGWLDMFFRGFVPSLVDSGHLAPADLEGFLAEWTTRSADPGAFYLTPPLLNAVAFRA